MKLCVLASGSKGNVTYFETNNTKILIDCGLSYRQLKKRLDDNNLSIDTMDGVLITHEHTDHVAGIDVLLKKIDTVCYLTEKTYHALHPKVKLNIKEKQTSFITPNEGFMINDIEILPLSISHDAKDAVGYVFTLKVKK